MPRASHPSAVAFVKLLRSLALSKRSQDSGTAFPNGYGSFCALGCAPAVACGPPDQPKFRSSTQYQLFEGENPERSNLARS